MGSGLAFSTLLKSNISPQHTNTKQANKEANAPVIIVNRDSFSYTPYHSSENVFKPSLYSAFPSLDFL
jgi:hypothetical protein